ncbi:MBL fold metallo-hydrolase [Chloroflexota bacterium]
MQVKFLGAHNCESKSSRYASLLIDDVLAIDAGALTSSLSFPAQQKLKAILLTHQHYDHIRDIPAIAMNATLHDFNINVYSTPAVYDALTNYLLNGTIYPDFLKIPQGNPSIKFRVIKPNRSEQVDGYSILAVPVSHSVPAVGYQVTSPDGKTVFYAGDTGQCLADCWQIVSPQLLIIEVTFPNSDQEFAIQANHLTPNLLAQELDSFQSLKGYLPQVITIHMNPRQEKEIEKEKPAIAKSLDSPIALAREDMVIQL